MINLDLFAEEFYNIIPKDVLDNIQFRIDLHRMLTNDERLQERFLDMCREYLPIFFATCCYTLNPHTRVNSLFIPWSDAQVDAILTLDKCIKEGRNFGINKSREEGATEIITKVFTAHCILYPLSNFIVGSRSADMVDLKGDDYTVIAKIDNVIDHLPSWFRLSEEEGTIYRKHMYVGFTKTRSAITGETTNESFRAGGRATAILLDEFGRVEKRIADSIEGSIHDISRCICYNSTHWYGAFHTFNVCIKKPTTKLVELLWYTNPDKAKGLYTSPKPGTIKLLDKEFYSAWKLPEEFELEDYPQFKDKFKADGCIGLPQPYRSPWHDYQEIDRDKRDFSCNVWACAYGAANTVFDHEVLAKVKKGLREPSYRGEIQYSFENFGYEDTYDVRFEQRSGIRNFKWWGPLIDNRPNQAHNYIIGCDISFGTGASNSVAEVYDVNTREQVGELADPTIPIHSFADLVIALCYWVGGTVDPFLIWESNGPGESFRERVLEHGYASVYMQTREDMKTRKPTEKYGWRAGAGPKEWLFSEFNIALSEGLKETPVYNSLKIYSDELYKELTDYIFSESGSEIITSSTADLSTGARRRHGDRATAMALCVLGCRDQIPGDVTKRRKIPFGSFGYYKLQEETKQKEDQRRSKRYLF